MLFKHLLSKEDAIFLLELINENLSCNGLVAMMRKLQCLIPYDFAICGKTVIGAAGKIKSYEICNISYPSEWIDLYIRKKYCMIDPIFKRALSQFGTQYWGNTYREIAPPKRFLSDARGFGIQNGYTGALKEHHSDIANFFSISGKSIEPNKRTELVLDIIGPHLDQSIHRFFKRTRECFLPSLSERERDVLSWSGQGKSSWDISVILGISERTVNFHVHNVMQKLGAVSRSQAVAIALHQGLINLE
jgi:DNA-binding CsgD family transcriptional regulator